MISMRDFLQITANGLSQSLQQHFGSFGFVLLTFPFSKPEDGSIRHADYVSNANREDVIKTLRHMAALLEQDKVPLSSSSICNQNQEH